MSTFRLEADIEEATREIERLAQRAGDLQPLLVAIGQGIEERIDKRFATSTGSDGQRWEENSPVTLAREALRLAVSGGNRKKDGSLNARGRRALAGKKPLIGETRALRDQIASQVSGTTLEVIASQAYAAIQQFGGSRSEFPHLWGDIPARPFMPITQTGDLYQAESDAIYDAIGDYIDGR